MDLIQFPFICVDCFDIHQKKISLHDLKCPHCGRVFSCMYSAPILFKKDSRFFSNSYIPDVSATDTLFRQTLRRFIDPSVNLSRLSAFNAVRNVFISNINVKILVIGAGFQRNGLVNFFKTDSVVACDVVYNSQIDVICDGSVLPFMDDYFDLVIITAVLEHVLDPVAVVFEINRVLNKGGFVYSEIPFLQRVHEGAFDFTRYTLSGHLNLFRQFNIEKYGIVAGPATSLLWSIESFGRAFSRNRVFRDLITLMVRVLFFWLKYFDFVIPDANQIEGASCTFVFAGKEKKSEFDVINAYGTTSRFKR